MYSIWCLQRHPVQRCSQGLYQRTDPLKPVSFLLALPVDSASLIARLDILRRLHKCFVLGKLTPRGGWQIEEILDSTTSCSCLRNSRKRQAGLCEQSRCSVVGGYLPRNYIWKCFSEREERAKLTFLLPLPRNTFLGMPKSNLESSLSGNAKWFQRSQSLSLCGIAKWKIFGSWNYRDSRHV